jgi:hypothetical protein
VCNFEKLISLYGKISTLVLACLGVACMAELRDPLKHSSSMLAGHARYVMVKLALANRWTFRLDRVCGNISQIVVTESEKMILESMPVMGLPKCAPEGKIRYQLFTSGLAAGHTYLLNTETGNACQIQSIKNKGWHSPKSVDK